jgi:carbon monoxide dehydrogenase subunit G
MPDVAWIRVRGDGRGEGARLDVRTKVLGIPAVTDEVLVTAWDPPRRLAVEHRGLVKGKGEWRLEPFGSGTRVTWTEELRLPGGVAGELAIRAYAPIQRAMLRRSIRNLGALCDAAR